LNNNDYVSIVNFSTRCYGCYDELEAEDIFNDLKKLIPFEYYAVGTAYTEHHLLHSVESLQWFKAMEGYEEFYISNRLYKTDPVAVEGLDQIIHNRVAVQFWRNTYKKNSNTDFFSKIEPFGMHKFDGYTHLYKINPVSFTTFSITGPKIPPKKDRRIMEILKHVIAPISMLARNSKIGVLSKLTDRQFEIYQLLNTGMTYDQIASALNLSRSSVEKCFTTIKGKIGLESKSHISFGAKPLP